tara:strand:- start:343 stop:564 length:222 start_codon:yes stop_codon:yes gene_type:complete
MNSSQLKYQYELNNENGYFFTPKTMRFFGDTMKNYGVITHNNMFELWRKKPVNGGLTKSAFFSKKSFQLICID